MNSEKVKEIKKVLGNCQKDNCLDCPYFIDEKRCRANDLLLDTITLINELESENELLRNAKVVYENVDYCYEDLKKAEKRIAELEGEITKSDIINSKLEMDIELLNKQNIDLEIDRDYYQEQFNEQEDFYVEWNKQQLKQFAERLIEKLKDNVNSDSVDMFVECKKLVDETLKEFVEL